MSGLSRISRVLVPLVTLVCIGLGVAYLVSQETPMGDVRGVVIMSESGKPLEDARLYLSPVNDDENRSGAEEGPRVRRSRQISTDADGSFRFAHVPAGTYHISANSSYHHISDVTIIVSESQTATVTLRMDRSGDDLIIGARQAVWSLKENPMLPVRGFIDPVRGDFDTLHMRVWRSRLSTLVQSAAGTKAIDSMDRVSDGIIDKMSDALLDPPGVPATRRPALVASVDVPIKDPDREGFYEQRLPVPAAGPGVYLVEVRHGSKTACSYVLATSMALVVKRAETQLVAYTVDMTTGTPVAGADVRQYRDGAIVAHGATDASGLAELTLPAIPKKASSDDDPENNDSQVNSRQLTVVVRGDDEAVLNRGDWTDSDRQDEFAVHAYTDRTIYRPGQSISYKAILRQRNDPKLGGLAYRVPAAGEPVTVEVRDPQGDRVVSESKTTNRWGTFSGSFDLSKEAPTGEYSLVCKVRGEKHTSDVAVASYRKPEFAVTVAPKRAHYVRGETVEMNVSAKYYFGAPVAGATVQYDVYRDSDWAAIYGPDYDADTDGPEESERGSYYGQSVVHGTVTLDANGEAVVSVPTDRKRQKAKSDEDPSADVWNVDSDTPDEQVLTCHATVTDDAKREVEADGTAHLAAGGFALTMTPEGYLASPGKPTSVVLSARDHDGKPVSGATVYLAASYQEWNSKTQATEKRSAGTTQKSVTGAGGSAVLNVIPTKAGELQLVATAYDSAGRALHAHSNLYAAGSDGSDMQTEYSDLSLLTDKKKYGPGDTARVLINTARVGETVLLTVEGDRVYRKSTIPIRHKSTVVSLPIEASWGPNVTLSACYVQKKKFAKSETPLRVRLDARTIAVTIQSDKAKYRPGETATYTIHTTDTRTGRPVSSEVSLAVVDESIYALRADTPNALRDAFYPHRTNRVTTLYSFDVAYLGDTDKSEPTIEMRRKFLDTAFWQPHLETDASGVARAAVPLPDNLTTWRATAQAISLDTSVGRATQKVLVTKPFFLRLDTPRFLTQNDDGRLLTLIHNDTSAAQNVHVRLSAPGLLKAGGDVLQTLQVVPGTDGQIEWPVSAQTVGTIPIKAEAWTDGRDAVSGKPFTDGIETTLPVRAFGREVFTTVAGQIADSTPGAVDDARTLTLDPRAVVSETRLTVRITPSLVASLAPALDYLTGYPYGCTEQTMSRILPDLLVERTAKLTNHALLTGPDGAKRMAALPRMVKDGIARLRRFQHPTGAWGWWEGDTDDPFLTAYVLSGIAYARDLGYEVPEKMRTEGIKGATEILKKASPDDRPFLMYALVMNGERGESLRLLHAVSAGRDKMAGMELRKLAPDSLAYLVLLAQHLKEDYRPAMHELERREIVEGRLLHWANAKDRWRSSDRMVTSLALRAYLAVNPGDFRIANILNYLMASRTDGQWGDTRDTSFVLNGLTDYLGYHPNDAAAPSATVALKINGVDIQQYDMATSSGGEAELLVRVPAGKLHAGNNRMELTRTGGSGTVFYAAALRQIVAAPAEGGLPATAFQGVAVTREYLKVASKAVGPSSWALVTQDAPGNKFRQDDHIRVRLTIKAPKDIDYVLIEDEYPSNLEVTERGTQEAALADTQGATTDWYDNVDVRDDRIAFFAAKLTKGTHTIEYNLRAQTPGVCRALPAQVQAMYAPEIRAESADSRIEVTK